MCITQRMKVSFDGNCYNKRNVQFPSTSSAKYVPNFMNLKYDISMCHSFIDREWLNQK